MGPGPVLELPHAGIALGPALLDGGDRRPDGPFAVGVEAVEGGGLGEQEEQFAERVELELGAPAVADAVTPARVSRYAQPALAGHRAPVDCIGGGEVGPVLEQTRAQEAHGVVEQVGDTGAGGGAPGVTLVADPDVPVVVVVPGVEALGQARGRRGDHPARRARHAAQDGGGVRGVAGRRPRGPGRRATPPRRGLLPDPVRVGRLADLLAELQHEVVTGAGGHSEVELEPRTAVGLHHRGGLTAGPAHRQVTEPRPPAPPVVAAQVVEAAAPVPGPRVEHHVHRCVDVPRLHPAQQHQPPRVPGEREGLPTLDDAAGRGPSLAPDQRRVLVETAPDERFPGGHRVASRSADQRPEHRARIPAGSAQPRHLAAGPDERAPVPVGQQRILPQHMG